MDELVKNINLAFRQNKKELNVLFNTFKTISDIFGILYYEVDIDEETKKTYLAWAKARACKDFTKADLYRNILVNKGIL